MSGPTGTLASRRYGGKRMNDKMVAILASTLTFALAFSILWVLGLLPTLVDVFIESIHFPFFN